MRRHRWSWPGFVLCCVGTLGCLQGCAIYGFHDWCRSIDDLGVDAQGRQLPPHRAGHVTHGTFVEIMAGMFVYPAAFAWDVVTMPLQVALGAGPYARQ